MRAALRTLAHASAACWVERRATEWEEKRITELLGPHGAFALEPSPPAASLCLGTSGQGAKTPFLKRGISLAEPRPGRGRQGPQSSPVAIQHHLNPPWTLWLVLNLSLIRR